MSFPQNMSRRTRLSEKQEVWPTISNVSKQQNSNDQQRMAANSSLLNPRNSMVSASSSGRRSVSSSDNSIRIGQPRRSGIPQPTSKTSQAKLTALASSRSGPTYTARTRTASTTPSTATSNRHRTILAINQDHDRDVQTRPKQFVPISVMDEKMAWRREYPVSTMDSEHDCVLGIPLPERAMIPTAANLPPRLIPELQALVGRGEHPRLATSSASVISSPSTQFTGSPSPWSASTAATTPISWSSASPFTIPLSKSPANNKRSQTVPIPAIARTNLPRLPILKENAYGPVGIQTIGVQPVTVTPPRRVKSRTPATSPAPSPPPRSSSIKRLRSRSNSKSGEQDALDSDSGPPPLPTPSQSSRLVDHNARYAQDSNPQFQAADLSKHHNSLQDALNTSTGSMSSPNKPRTSETFTEAFPAVVSNQTQSRRLLEPAVVEAGSRAQTSARSRLAKFSKMALFGFRSQDNAADTKSSSPTRKLQKGPSAGTGHEGYNRYTRRGRKSTSEGSAVVTDSETSVASVARKPMSTLSRKDSSSRTRKDRQSQSDLDDFASSRLKPFVMRGGSQSVTVASQNSPSKVASMITNSDDSINETSVSQEHGRGAKYTLFDTQPTKDAPSRLQKGSSDLLQAQKSTFQGNTSLSEAYPNAWSVSQSSLTPSSVATTDVGSNLYKGDLNIYDEQKKSIRKSRWNIFRRREEYQPQHPRMIGSSRGLSQGMAVTVSAQPPSRSLPFYAMLESESEGNTTEAIGDYLREAATMTDIDDDEYNIPTEDYGTQQPKRAESVLLPSAPRYNPDIERSRGIEEQAASRSMNSKEEDASQTFEDTHTPRQPRLAQVGRIPKVVSAERVRQPNRMSFSRPFQQKGMSEDHQQIRALQDEHDLQVKPVTEVTHNRQPLKIDTSGFANISENPFPHLHGRALQQPYVNDQPKIQDRQSITSSSSDGAISVMGPPLLPTSEPIRPAIRRTFLEEDVWNEYDDLLDHVVSPLTPTKPNRSNTKIGSSTKPTTLSQRREIRHEITRNAPSLRSLAQGLAIDTSFLPPPIIFASPELLQESDADEIRLRRSRIVSALHSSLDPSSPFSIGDYLHEHGDIKRGSDRTSNHLSVSTASRGFPSPNMMAPIGNLPTPVQRYDNIVHIDEVQRTRNPVRHSELAYTSLMVSRWLSFGRVLFSPAHADVTNTPERHVLIIDGLGSDDWSIYCAVTYQSEHAYIYDLKETGRSHFSNASKKSDNAPPNLRRREVRSFYDPFKFPDNFFSAIVLRFPPVMAESKMKNLISECRRVLAPGGYLELMLLDLDIVNMGVLTRRALRDLKTRVAVADPGVSLKPVIDNFTSILGDKGFSKLSRCVVGVPVVGKPPGAADSPVSSRSSGGSDKPPLSSSAGPHPFDGIYGQANHNFSLNDLVADHSDNADAKISKMVSRTARNWWQHCFEAAVIVNGDLSSSILADRQVLKECKSRASSFKLLIAFTQKPFKPSIEAKRRTMSEPFVATLATA